MRTKRRTVTIKIELFDLGGMECLLNHFQRHFTAQCPFEAHAGHLTFSDTDHIEWKTEERDVEI